MTATYLFLLPFLNPCGSSRSFITIIPLVSILVSALFFDVFQKIRSGTFKTASLSKKLSCGFAGIILILFFLNQIGGDLYILWKHRDNDFYDFISEVRKTIPKEAKTWGSMTFWMGLHDYPYITEISPFEEVIKFKPEYAILYDSMNWGGESAIVARTQANVAWLYEDRPRKMEALCKKQGTFIREIKNKYYGDIHIYRIHWPD